LGPFSGNEWSEETRQVTTASGLSNFIRTMSGSFATAITVWMWNRRSDYHHALLSESIRDAGSGWLPYRAQLAALGIQGQNAFDYVDGVITRQASTMGASDVFVALGCLYFLLIPFIWLARPPFGARRGGGAH